MVTLYRLQVVCQLLIKLILYERTMSQDGFIPISRKFFEHDFWTAKRTYSKAEAWIDIIQSARFEIIPKRQLIGNSFIDLRRGEFVASIRFLVKRWKWSSHKVLDFLELLESEQMIVVKKEHGISIISICKYDSYNQFQIRKGTEKEQQRNGDGTGTEQQRNEVNKGNKDNKEIKEKRERFSPPALQQVEEYFLQAGDQTEGEAEKFFNYYDSKGWKVGKVKMSKWESAAANWIKRMKEFKKEKISGKKEKITSDDRINQDQRIKELNELRYSQEN